MSTADIFEPIGASGLTGAALSGQVLHQIGLARELAPNRQDVSLREVENQRQMWLTQHHTHRAA